MFSLHWLAAGVVLAYAGTQLFNSAQSVHAGTYDSMVKQRLFSPSIDPDILILDIDEASLAAMSGEFGRWPWPRDTLGATLEYLERSGAAGVVFDILFSDPDRQNPASDEAFAEIVAQSNASWFPVLRLNPDNDASSKLKLADLKGFAVSAAGLADAAATVAAVPPFFNSALQSGRLGYHNVFPDADSIIRSYRYTELKNGWQINALPSSIALAKGWALPRHAHTLLNWHDKKASYTRQSFYTVYEASQKKNHALNLNPAAFKNKWVIIGSTAPSLHDVKATPLKAIHPGVEVLALALDNAKNNHYLYTLPQWFIALVTLLVVFLSVRLIRLYSQEQLSLAFVFVPSVLLLVSFLSLHLSPYFIDLTIPAQSAFALLTFVKVHMQLLSWAHASDQLMYSEASRKDGEQFSTVQIIAATGKRAHQGVVDWALFESMRRHSGVLYLDNRSSKHPLADGQFRWWTIVTAQPEIAGNSVLKATSSAAEIHYQRACQLCDTAAGLATVKLASYRSALAFSESLARSQFWKAVAKHDTD